MRTERQHGNGQEKFRPIEAIPAFKLAKNQPLEDLARYLRKKPKDFDTVMDRIISYEAAWRHDVETVRADGARGIVAEAYVRDRIIAFSKQGAIGVNPIPDGARTSSHVFRYSSGSRFEVFHRNGGTLFTELDVLFRAGKLPVTGEVKSGGSRFGSAFSPETVSSKLTPVGIYFNTDTLGYVAIGPQDILQRDDGRMAKFEEKGGVIVALPVTTEAFIVYAKELEDQCHRLRTGRRGHRQRARR